jgi:hypothetical protein
MNSNLSSSNTMNQASSAAAAKKVAKKIVTGTATPTTDVVPKKANKKQEEAVPVAPAVAAAVAAPVIPVASAVETAATPIAQPTFAEEIASTLSQLSSIKDAAASAIKTLQKLEKRHNREVKDARKRRKRNTKSTESGSGEAPVEGGDAAAATQVKRTSIFKTPIPLNDALATLLGKMKDTLVCPTDIMHLVNMYISEHNLKADGVINHDATLRSTLGIKDGEKVTYRDIQKKVYAIVKNIIASNSN